MSYDCEYYKELISASLDGELNTEEERILSAHLESCEECRKIKKEYEYISLLTSGKKDREEPEDMSEKIMERIRQSAKHKRKSFIRYFELAACVAVVILGAVVFKDGRAAKTSAGFAVNEAAIIEAPMEAAPSLASAEESIAAADVNSAENQIIETKGFSHDEIISLFDIESDAADIIFDFSAELITEDDEIIYIYISGDRVYCYTDDDTLMQTEMNREEFELFVQSGK